MISLSYQTPDGHTQTLLIDAEISEKYQANVTITDHPVENTANISDHVRPLPKTLQIDGVLVDQPTGIGAMDRGYKGRAAFNFSRLEALRDSATLIQAVTPKRTYTDLLIQDVGKAKNKDASEGSGAAWGAESLIDPRELGGNTPEDRTGSIAFTATLKQVILVSTEQVSSAIARPPVVNTGAKQGTPPTEGEQKALKSWLTDGVDSGKDLVRMGADAIKKLIGGSP